MEKLVSTSEAAKLLGISVQGVHYRIRKQQLKSIKQDGRTFVYLDNKKIPQTSSSQTSSIDLNMLQSKDEQINLLKTTMKWMKKQYKQEIKRLNENQDKLIDVFKSEITLLQQAYNEMQKIYKIEHKKDTNLDLNFLTIKEFFGIMKKYNKTNEQIKQIIIQRVKAKDDRFIYNTKTQELLICNSDFTDLI